jgi:hypothetical protein
MPIACKYCIATKGLTLQSDHLFDTEDELIDHIEMEHDMPVEREGETEEQTMARFKAKNPRAGGPDCQCPACLRNRENRRAPLYGLVDRLSGLP